MVATFTWTSTNHGPIGGGGKSILLRTWRNAWKSGALPRSIFGPCFSERDRTGPTMSEGRHVIETTHSNSRWEVIVEPDVEDRLLVVVTGYAIEGTR